MTGRVNNELIIEQEAAKASYFYEKRGENVSGKNQHNKRKY